MSLGVSGPSSAGGRAVGASRPGFLEAALAAEAIRKAVAPPPGGLLTVADAAAKSGLALRDADNGLKWLSSEYRGQLRVTEEGELVHVFPTGFAKPWETRDAWSNAARAAGRGFMGALRFVVRAWVAIVLVGYTAIFLGLVIAMAFARQGSDDRRSGGSLPGALAYSFSRIVADALFWTFRPWSPLAMGYAPGGAWNARDNGWTQARRRRDEPTVALYERVNRFFFGPTEPPADPRETERLVIAAIRAGKGRIGLADVMRVTGLPRDQADPMMARLMLDYDGDVDVSEEGGIVYRFAALRKTASEASEPEPPPVWNRVKKMPPLTGNPIGANVVIFLLNGFNLLMGLWAIENGLTLERAAHLFDRVPHPIVDTGVPLVLGVIPFVFSSLLFMLPVARLVTRPFQKRAFSAEQGRLAVLRQVLERVRGKQPVTDAQLAQAWRSATGLPPDPKRLGRELVALGGDVVVDPAGQTRWRFADLETEAAAVEAERQAAADEEATLGKVVYATDDR